MRSPTPSLSRRVIARWVALAQTVVVALLACGCQSNRQEIPPAMRQLAILLPQTDGPLVLHVRSDAFEPGQEIADTYSAYHANVSPPLGWSGVPESAKSIVVLAEDPDAPEPNKPFTHWILYNLPPTTERLPQDLPKQRQLTDPVTGVQGTNAAGQVGYFGPKPPRGDPAHHYHFQVFALDRVLQLRPDATRQDLLNAMAGHVVAKGQLVGTYRER